MSEVTDNLKRLTPTAINRDALLVAMAKASVPNRSAIWPWLCFALAVSQLTMGLVWWRSTAVVPSTIPNSPHEPTHSIRETAPIEPYSYLALRSNDTESRFTTTRSDDHHETPILRAGQRTFDNIP